MVYTHTARTVAMSFGRRVRACRLAASISQAALGRRARVSEKCIGQIERGKTNPSLETMVLIVEALGCNLADLLQPGNASAYVSLRADDLHRAQEALAAMALVLTSRKRSRRDP